MGLAKNRYHHEIGRKKIRRMVYSDPEKLIFHIRLFPVLGQYQINIEFPYSNISAPRIAELFHLLAVLAKQARAVKRQPGFRTE